jgi:SPP1 family predicted phage head-tail adaptor
MNPGELKHRAVIQAVMRVPTASGQPTKTWRTLTTVWAKVEPISGREYMLAQQAQSEVTAKITVRYNAIFTSDLRVVVNGKTYEIESVINLDEANRYLELMCKEAAA